jgi:hypothetical protein
VKDFYITSLFGFSFQTRLFVEALIMWQSTCDIGNVLLLSILNAIENCKSKTQQILMLLEATLFNYFRHSGEF